MRIWHKDNYWVSQMPFKAPTTRDISLVDIKPLVNLCLQIRNDVVE